MRVSDVDVNIIHKLLLSVPQGMELTSIDLTNGYTLNLKASTDIVDNLEYEYALEQLQDLIRGQEKDVKKLGRKR